MGQSVFAIGNPRGYSRTMTAGVVSGLNRAIPSPVNTLTYGAIQVRNYQLPSVFGSRKKVTESRNTRYRQGTCAHTHRRNEIDCKKQLKHEVAELLG